MAFGSDNSTASIPKYALLSSFFAFGCAAVLSQTLLLRELLVTFHGTELSVGAFYGGWFVWIALGALAGPRILGRWLSDRQLYVGFCLFLPAALLPEMVFLRYFRVLSGVGPLELTTLESMLLGAGAATALPAFTIGAIFPVAAKLLKTEARAEEPVSLGYAYEALGSLLGGLVFTWLLATGFRPMTTLALAGLVAAAAVAVVAWSVRWRAAAVTAAVSALVWSAGFTHLGSRLDRVWERARWKSLQRGYHLITSFYTPYSHVALGSTAAEPEPGRPAAVSRVHHGLFHDGVQAASFPDPHRYAQTAAHAMALHPEARRVLLLGSGPEGLAQQFLRYPTVRTIDTVSLDPWAIRVVKNHLPEDQLRMLSDTRLKLVFSDARQFVNSSAPRRYDLVVLNFPRPTTAAMNRFFTQEFFTGIRRLLDAGVVMLNFDRDEPSYLAREERLALGSVFATMRTVFPWVEVITGDLHYMAGFQKESMVLKEPRELLPRYRSLRLASYPFPPEGIPDGVSAERSVKLRTELAGSGAQINTDAKPVAYFYGLLYLGKLSRSRLTGVLVGFRAMGPWALYVLVMVLFALMAGRRLIEADPAKSRARHSAAAIATVGLASMSLQVVILIAYQSRLGSLYQEVGSLTGLFMTGLAAGAFFGRWISRRVRRPQVLLLAGLVVVSAISGILPLGLESLGSASTGLSTAGHLLFSTISGFATGGVFPLAAVAYDPGEADVGRTASILDAADHLGACTGGLAAGVLMVPVFGMATTCRVLTATTLAAAGLVALDLLLERFRLRAEPAPARLTSFPWMPASFRIGAAMAAVFVLSSFARAGLTRIQRERDEILESPALEREVHEAGSRKGASVVFNRQPFPHFAVMKDKTLEELIFSTRHLAPDVRAYAGSVELVVRMKADGTLLNVLLGRHQETPSYVTGVPGWLRNFQGKPLKEPLTGKRGVDALTSATVTCQAIKKILKISRARAAREVLRLSPDRAPAPQGERVAGVWADPKLWGVVVLLILAVVVYTRATPYLRLCCLGVSTAVLGFWLNLPLTTVDLALLTQWTIPGTAVKTATVAGAAVMALMLGQVWCGYVCPFGALQEFVWLAIHPAGISADAGLAQAKHTDGKFERSARYVKFCVLAAALVCFWITLDQVFLMFDPMVWVFQLDLQFWKLALLAVLLVGSFVFFRPWCRYVCPVGALLALGNKAALLDRWTSKRRVGRCDLGVGFARDADCVRCNRCAGTHGRKM